jgi:hypothetical protein
VCYPPSPNKHILIQGSPDTITDASVPRTYGSIKTYGEMCAGGNSLSNKVANKDYWQQKCHRSESSHIVSDATWGYLPWVAAMLSLPQVGDRVVATLNRPIIVDGEEVASAETPVRAKLTYARRNGRFHHAGYLTLRLASMDLHAADTGWKAMPFEIMVIAILATTWRKLAVWQVLGNHRCLGRRP